MAASVHDTIRMDNALTGNLPTTEWSVIFENAGLSDIKYAAVSSERSITGKLLVHRVTSAGSVVRFQDYHYTLILTGMSDKSALEAMVGKLLYFMPHYRDESAALSYRYVILFQSMSDCLPMNPYMEYWQTRVNLVDASDLTVD